MLLDLLLIVLMAVAVPAALVALLAACFVIGLLLPTTRLRTFTRLPDARAPRSGAAVRMARELEAQGFRFVVAADENEPGWPGVRSAVFLSADRRTLALAPSHFPLQQPALLSRPRGGGWIHSLGGGWPDLPEDSATASLDGRTLPQLIAFHLDRLEAEAAVPGLEPWRDGDCLDRLNERERAAAERAVDAGLARWTDAGRTRWRTTVRGAIARVVQAARSFRAGEHPLAAAYPPRRRR